MAWVSLGTIPLMDTWQQYELPSIGTELFRIQSPSDLRVYGPALLGSYYAVGGRGEIIRIYFSPDPRIIELTIPTELKQSGFILRYIQAKLSSKTKVDVGQTWNLTVEGYQ